MSEPYENGESTKQMSLAELYQKFEDWVQQYNEQNLGANKSAPCQPSKLYEIDCTVQDIFVHCNNGHIYSDSADLPIATIRFDAVQPPTFKAVIERMFKLVYKRCDDSGETGSVSSD